MEKMSLVEDLRYYILNQYLSGESIEKLGVNDNLIDNGILDSMTLLKFVSYLENNYELEISNEELTPDNFESIKAIAHFLETKKANG